jgi:uncharacterized membrane protein YeaQ/YmgE (transglycosylase-associated protein family)
VETARKEHIVGLVAWILLGLIAGGIAVALYKDDRISIAGTFTVGVVGALLGGLIASALGDGSVSSFFSVTAWLIALGGAFVLLLVFDAVVVRRGDRDDPRARA